MDASARLKIAPADASLQDESAAVRHFGSLIAVDGVSLTIEPGELRAIIGPNGAGKTTFFNLISGFFAPTSGAILFDGKDIIGLTPEQRVNHGMARTFQITEIFPELNVADNLRIAVEVAAGLGMQAWVSRARRREVDARVAELLEMGDLIDKKDRNVGVLSHGDQRAVEIMMALALRPRLLMLDEPTAGMGDQETYEIARLIRRLHRKERLSMMLIEHDMRVVFNLADRIMVLAEGRVLAEGTPDEIAASEAVQAAYLGKAAA
jgi:branched-chain amino acid transport system ATP-binding protein